MHLLEPSIAQFWGALATQGTSAEEPIPDIECLQVHFMLAGLAIENLCKGYLVTRLSPEEKAKLEEGRLPKRLDQQHKIRRLVSETNLQTSEVENELLERVEDSVRWLGRYPAPKYATEMINEISAATDAEQIGNFLRRLETHVGLSE